MSRSTKKGPFVEASLFKKVEALNEKGDKQVMRRGHWPPAPQKQLRP